MCHKFFLLFSGATMFYSGGFVKLVIGYWLMVKGYWPGVGGTTKLGTHLHYGVVLFVCAIHDPNIAS
jgi:hypothetical protein